MKSSKLLVLGLTLMLFSVLVFGISVIGMAAEEWPTRPISVICFSSAGGGTDTWNRAVAGVMQEILGEPMSVSNMTGGRGGVAATYVWDHPHDGYLVLGASETLLLLCTNDAHPTTVKDWEFFVAAGAPGCIVVRSDSPYKTFEDFINAAKANPGKISISNSGIGKLWHMKAAMMDEYAGLSFKYIPYKGSHPTIVACLQGETDAAVASTGEVSAFVKAGELRPLVMNEPEPSTPFEGYDEIPAITEFFPQLKKYLPLNQWLGYMLPADTPQSVLEKFARAFEQALEDQRVKDLAGLRGETIYGLTGKEAKDFAFKMQSKLCWTQYQMGFSTISPLECDIPKP